MKILGKLLLTLASLAYPLLWYYGRENGAFFWLAAVMCVLWLIRAAMPQTTAQRITAIILAAFFAAVLVFRRPDSMYWYPVAVNALMLAVFRWQPICQTNRYRTPRPTATPRPAAQRCAPHSARYANLVRLLCLQRRNRRHFGRLTILRLVGGLYRHRVLCVNGNLICWRVGISESRIKGVGRLKIYLPIHKIVLPFLSSFPRRRKSIIDSKKHLI